MSEYSLSFWLVLLIGLHDPIYVQESHLKHRSIKYFALRRGFLSGIRKDKERYINRRRASRKKVQPSLDLERVAS